MLSYFFRENWVLINTAAEIFETTQPLLIELRNFGSYLFSQKAAVFLVNFHKTRQK
jgi:hypothetical protein